jgi:hypothetical protein
MSVRASLARCQAFRASGPPLYHSPLSLPLSLTYTHTHTHTHTPTPARMETAEDPGTVAAALASSLASSTLGLGSTHTLGASSIAGGGGSATAEARLGALVGKLGHPLREVRLRALRNLRLKLATPELLLASSPTADGPPSPQGLLRSFFAAQGPQLYQHLRAALLDDGDEALRGEALMFLAEVCRQPGQQAARRGYVCVVVLARRPCVTMRAWGASCGRPFCPLLL